MGINSLIVLIALLAGSAAGMNWLAAQDAAAPLTARALPLPLTVGAALFVAALLLVRWITVAAVRRLAPDADTRRRFLRLDVLSYLPALAPLLGAVGVQMIPPVIVGAAMLVVMLKIGLLLAALPPRRRSDAFSSQGYLAFLFLVSGLAALVYQIVWQRTLFAAFGVDIKSTTLIVSLFMFGLGVGSLLGGLFSARFPGSAPLLFLCCEVGIGLFGIVSLPLIGHVSAATLHGSLVQVSLAIFALLCIPTMLMGATLPILVGHLHRHTRNVGRSVGLLYCINTLGSAVACFLTADLLFVFLGQQGAVYVAAACNLAVGVLVSRYARSIAPFTATVEETKNDPAPDASTGFAAARHRRLFVLTFAAAAGYISLSQEIVWMRAVSYMTGGEPTVFAHVLGFFLVGVALGSLCAERLCRGRLAGNRAAAVRAVAAMLFASAVAYYLSIVVTARLLTVWRPLGVCCMYVLVTAVSFLLGGVFPVLCHYGARAGQAVGLTVSRLYLANIVGSTLGPLLTGFVLMECFGTDQIILGLSLATLLLAGAASLLDPARPRLGRAALCAAGAAAMVLVHRPLYAAILERLHFQEHYYPDLRYSHLTQNRSGIIAVLPDPAELADLLYGGGMYDGNFNVDPYLNSNGIDRAYFVAALHPSPAEVLEVGLASGSWSRVLAAYAPVQRHVIVEINPGYLPIIAQYAPQNDLLADPKVSIHIDDGRRWLKRHPDQRFDFILQNTTWHWRSHSTNLLSREYFELCRARLKPGGVFYCNATGSDDVAYTLARVFRHTVRYGSFVAASDEPFVLTRQQVAANLARFRLDELVGRHADRVRPVLARLADRPLHDEAPALRSRSDFHLITDDNMATEYKRHRLYRPDRAWLTRLARPALISQSTSAVR